MFLSTLGKLLRRKPSAAPARRAGALRVESLESRVVPATFTVSPGESIQAALNAAAARNGADTVVVKAGTYTEALVVNDAARVTLRAAGAVTLLSPANLTPLTLGGTRVGAALIDIYSDNVTVDGFTVSGATNTDGDLFAGIRVIRGGSATIRNNTVTGLLNASDPDANIGIQVGTSRVPGAPGAGAATVTDNTVLNYRGAGVLVDGRWASASVEGNTITGRGAANGGGVQYGVQVSRGATACVSDNTISGNDSDGPAAGGSNPDPTSAGVYFFDAGCGNRASGNAVFGNDTGILVDRSAGSVEIEDNCVYRNNGYAGIAVLLSRNVEVEGNAVFNNTALNGIALDRSRGIEVERNDVFNNANADGIYVFQGGGNRIAGNDVSGSGYNGILIEDSANNCLVGNRTTGNAQNGVKVLGGSGNDILFGRSAGNGGNGILLQDTRDTAVIGNVLVGNAGAGLRRVNADGVFAAFNWIACNG